MTNDIMSLCDKFNVVYSFFFGFHLENYMEIENRSNLFLSEIAILLFDFNLLVCTVFTSICES